MKTSLLALLACGLLVRTTLAAAPVVGNDLSPEDVRNAIRTGVQYLESTQRNGKWGEYLQYTGGVTALCTLALLNAGESPEEPHVKLALKYLRDTTFDTTYVVSLQTMVLCRATPVADQEHIAKNVKWLEDHQLQSGPAGRKDGWKYDEQTGSGDPSNSQFALLALYEAARAAEAGQGKIVLTVNRETWERARNYWIYNQVDNSYWAYNDRRDGTGSMTCAGIAALVITGDMLHEPDAKVSGDQIDSCYRALGEDQYQEHIDNGIKWLANHFTVRTNPPVTTIESPLWHYYYLYGLERAGRLAARRKFGRYDWYREGAQYLVQEIGGAVSRSSWQGGDTAETDPNIATSMALLFLSKGRWPVLMAKAQYPSPTRIDAAWNRHRNDVNNLSIYVGAKWQRELTWQTIELDKATVDDLLQVPVLFFSGGGSPLPEREEKRRELAVKLRDYLDRGGFIFADGEACSSDFDRGFRELLDLAFDKKPEYGFKPILASHPIWIAEQKIPPDQARLLLGIDYGCRTSVVYSPSHPAGDPKPSLATLWELSRGGLRESYSPAVKEKIEGGLAIGINVLAYATNRELKDKDPVPPTLGDKGPNDAVQRGKLAIAKLQHPGGCDAAPRALANLMEQAARDMKIRVETHPKLISMEDPVLFEYAVVFMHGRNAFHLIDGERQALRAFVKRGGLLFADSICGSEAFTESFRREMAVIFPENALVSISPRDPIWTDKYGGFNLPTVMRRDPQPGRPGEPMKSALRPVPPELQGVRIADHYGVIFSAFDLSCALEKHDSMDCRGYTREDAARIGLNVLRYAMQPTVAPTNP
jgi:hypothetical protein